MDKLIIIKESDLQKLIKEAVTNAVDGVTKKIASRAAVRSYNNEIFRHRVPVVESTGGCGADDDDDGGCGSSSSSRRTTSYSSCGGSYDYSYGGCGSSSNGGCGSSSGRSSRSSGGCGGGYESGGC